MKPLFHSHREALEMHKEQAFDYRYGVLSYIPFFLKIFQFSFLTIFLASKDILTCKSDGFFYFFKFKENKNNYCNLAFSPSNIDILNVINYLHIIYDIIINICQWYSL